MNWILWIGCRGCGAEHRYHRFVDEDIAMLMLRDAGGNYCVGCENREAYWSKALPDGCLSVE